MIKSANNIPVDKLLGINNNSQELFYKIPPYQKLLMGKEAMGETIEDRSLVLAQEFINLLSN